ncbi:MAG: HAMP domain-containing sensor histidine kinase [Chitinophagaceae bacterium]
MNIDFTIAVPYLQFRLNRAKEAKPSFIFFYHFLSWFNVIRSSTIYSVLLSVIFCACMKNAVAQFESSIQIYDTEKGLFQNSVLNMTMDYDGYLWMVTERKMITGENLTRYDGSTFKSFSFRKDRTQVSSSIQFITNTLGDKKTIIGLANGQTYSLEKGRLVVQENMARTRYAETISGYFNTASGFNKFNTILQNHPAEQHWAIKALNAVQLDTADFVVSYNYTSILFYYQNGVRTKDIQLDGKVEALLLVDGFCIIKDENSNLYLFDKSIANIHKINIDWKGFNVSPSQGSDLAFYQDQLNHKSWCIFNSTLYDVSLDSIQNLLHFSPRFSIKDKKHLWKGVTFDSSSSTFFLSTLTEGMFQVKVKKIKTFNLTDSLAKGPDPNIFINYSIVKTSDSTAVIPSGFEFNVKENGTIFKKLGNLFGNRETIAKLTDGRILVGQGENLFYYSPSDNYKNKHVFSDLFTRINNSDVILIYPEGDSIWVSSNEQIYCLTKNKCTVVYQHKPGDSLNLASMHLFYRISENEALISNLLGSFRLQTKAPYTITEIPELKTKQIRYIEPYKDLLILSLHNSGLTVLKNGKFYPVPISPEQADVSGCHSTYIDSKGFLWITTNGGLFKTTVESVIDAAINKKTIPFFFYYGKEDGIDNTEFNGAGNPSYAVLKDQQLFYPSMGGIVSFRPASMEETMSRKKIFIEKILVDTTEIENIPDTIEIQPNYRQFSIEVSAPYYQDPKNLVIEYSLDSINWKRLANSDRNKITIADVSAGIYRLLIRKRAGFKNNDYIYTAPLFINIRKSMYEQAWFYLAVILLIGLLYLFFIKIQTWNINQKRKLLQLKIKEQTNELSQSAEVKDLLMTIILHDMVTPLRHISFISEILKKGFEKDPKMTEQALDDIQATADKMSANSASIINWIKYNNKQVAIEKEDVNVRDAVDEAFDQCRPLAQSKEIILSNEVPFDKFVNADLTILRTIIDNIITNAIKHTTSGQVKVFLDSTPSSQKTRLKISDTGTGFKDDVLAITREVLTGNLHALKLHEKATPGLGYIIISELIKMHNISITIDSELDKGTVVTIEI